MVPRTLLLVLGAILLLAGIFWPFLARYGIGRLPGDIVINRGNLHIYIPLATSLLVSVVLTLLFWALRK